MKVAMKRDDLVRAVGHAAAVVPAKAVKPILECAKLSASDGGTFLSATDLEIELHLALDEIRVDEPGVALLPCRRLFAAVRESSAEDVTVSGDHVHVTVTAGTSRHRFFGMKVDEFPARVVTESSAMVEVPAEAFRHAVRRTVFATDQAETRYALGGVLWEFEEHILWMVATDGRRMAVQELVADGAGEGVTGIVPKKALQVMARLAGEEKVWLGVAGNSAYFTSDRVMMSARMVEGRFPKWREMLEQTRPKSWVSVNCGVLLSAVREVLAAADQEPYTVSWLLGGGKLLLTVQGSIGESTAEVPVSYDGEDVDVYLNGRYVAECLSALDAASVVRFGMPGGYRLALDSEDGYSYLQMGLDR